MIQIPQGNMNDSTIDISIVIPTYNEEKVIVNKLNNTIHLNYPKDRMEIIVVDCSNDNTVKFIEDWAKDHKDIKIILHHDDKRKPVVYATNKGISLASGEIIIRVDADSTLEKESLKRVMETFKDKKIGCVTGRPSPVGSTKEKDYRDIGTKMQLLETKIDSSLISHGSFTAFRKNINVVIDERFGAEDSGISVKVRKLGFKSVLNPDIIFYEKISLKGREEQKIRRAASLISMLWANKDVLFNIKYGWYGILIFPFYFFLTIVIPFLLSPLLIILILFNIKGGTVLETFQFLLKAIYTLLFVNKSTVYWEKDEDIRGI